MSRLRTHNLRRLRAVAGDGIPWNCPVHGIRRDVWMTDVREGRLFVLKCPRHGRHCRSIAIWRDDAFTTVNMRELPAIEDAERVDAGLPMIHTPGARS